MQNTFEEGKTCQELAPNSPQNFILSLEVNPHQAPSQHTKRSRVRKKILDHSVTSLPITLVYPSTPVGGGCENVFLQNLPGVLSFQN